MMLASIENGRKVCIDVAYMDQEQDDGRSLSASIPNNLCPSH